MFSDYHTQAESQRASLEKQMRESVDKAKKDVRPTTCVLEMQITCTSCINLIQAALEAQRDAEQRRMEDQAAMDLERERNRRREQELLAQQSGAQPEPMEEGELQAELARLQLLESRQKEEINR